MTSRNLSPGWLKFIKSVGIEFWLPLPLLGLSFWFVGGWLTEQTLSRPSKNLTQLKTTQPDYGKKIALIKVEIYPQQGISLVTVKKAENKISTRYTKSQIILNTTHIPSVEAKISNELGISRERLRNKLRYRWEQ
ncbi:hypothetical protein Riv7116_0987 [Rivularia sp. PCC 7116]|uniref:hypothetical protein n=1 Tax=Rivularia sp. PCC 7116 TaxID=373994 RepID=UPI00029F1764|nr:hypothetical protein [Rivularia sp. PCC 7116]AFY53562.1 hypothetical protein Riv7116_0987 [Rivularia sp. PCC 7116]